MRFLCGCLSLEPVFSTFSPTGLIPTSVSYTSTAQAAYLQSGSLQELTGRVVPGLTFEKTHSTFPLLAAERVKWRTRNVIDDGLEPRSPAMSWQIGKGPQQAQKSLLTTSQSRESPVLLSSLAGSGLPQVQRSSRV